MFDGILKFFGQFFQTIGSFFKGLFGFNKHVEPPHPYATTPASHTTTVAAPEVTPEVTPSAPLMGPPAPESTPEQKPMRELISEEDRNAIKDAISQHHRYGVNDQVNFTVSRTEMDARNDMAIDAEREARELKIAKGAVESGIRNGQSISEVAKRRGIPEETLWKAMQPEALDTAKGMVSETEKLRSEWQHSPAADNLYKDWEEARRGRTGTNPVDPSIGTESNPIFTQDNSGRMIVNLPENATARVTRVAGSSDLSIIVDPPVMPNLNDPNSRAAFTSDRINIPAHMLADNEVVFQAPDTGMNKITIDNGIAPENTILAVKTHGADVKHYGADAIVAQDNGHYQHQSDARYAMQARRDQLAEAGNQKREQAKQAGQEKFAAVDTPQGSDAAARQDRFAERNERILANRHEKLASASAQERSGASPRYQRHSRAQDGSHGSGFGQSNIVAQPHIISLGGKYTGGFHTTPKSR